MYTHTANHFAVGTKVYYTGDMANRSGWFEVTAYNSNAGYTLREFADGEGRTLRGIYPGQIGEVYHGHCNPRFVTETAYNTYRNQRG